MPTNLPTHCIYLTYIEHLVDSCLGRNNMYSRSLKAIWAKQLVHSFPCWMPKPLPPWNHYTGWSQWSGRFLSIIGWDPSVCKSNRLHVGTIRFFYLNLRYIPWIPLKWSVILLKSWTAAIFPSNSTGSSVTNCRFSSIIGWFALGGGGRYGIQYTRLPRRRSLALAVAT